MIGTILSGASSLLQTGMGIYQMIKGSQIKPERPEMEVSDAQQMATATMRNQYMGEMAGASQARQDIATGQQAAISAAQRAGDASQVLAMAGASQSTAGKQRREQLIDQAAMKASLAQAYSGQLNRQALEERAAWDYNENQPYQQEVDTKAAMMEGGMKNVMSGLNAGASLGMAGQKGLLGSVLGGGGGNNPDAAENFVPQPDRNWMMQAPAGMGALGLMDFMNPITFPQDDYKNRYKGTY